MESCVLILYLSLAGGTKYALVFMHSLCSLSLPLYLCTPFMKKINIQQIKCHMKNA